MEPIATQIIDEALERPYFDRETRFSIVVMAAAVKSANLARHALEAAHRGGLLRATVTEVGLQLGLFAGFPRCISVMGMIASLWGKTDLLPRSLAAAELDALRERGLGLFRRIYAHNTERVLADLNRFDPDIVDLVMVGAYGRILTRPELSAANRELCAVAALTVSGDLKQLSSHARGAVHCGAAEHQLSDVLALILGIAAPDFHAEAVAIVERITKPPSA